MKRILAAAAAAGLLLVARGTRAEEPPRFIVDTYDIIGGCPDEAAFRAEVERRVHGRTKTPMHVVVHVNQEPRNIEGSVEVVDESGARTIRKVSSPRCAEIVSAAALVVALAIDDAAENEPAAKPTPPPPPPPTGEVTPNLAPLTIDTSERKAAKNDDLVFRAGAQGAIQSAVGPHPVLSVPVFVELGNEARRPGFHVEPRARLAWTFAASSDGEAPTGTATFTWMSGAADLCPVRLALATAGSVAVADLRACGRFEVGRLAATSHGNDSPRTPATRLWLAAGVPVTFRFLPRQLRPLFFELEGGPRLPLVRDRFEVGPPSAAGAKSVYETPALGFTAGIGAGVGFR